MEFLIVTGMSGSGKSACIKVLEDIGFFCIDNMPPALIPNFAALCNELGIENSGDSGIRRVAIVTDIRGGAMFLKLSERIVELRNTDGINVKVMFLEASKEVLMKRYSETRRKHPFDEISDGDLGRAIDAEIELLSDVRVHADYIIDSSLLTTAQLKEQIAELFLDKPTDRLIVSCMSFGFKYGVPGEADLVFDVRCLPNPFYVPELKHKTGLDPEVRDYVMNCEDSKVLERKIRELTDFLIPLYIKEGKSRLVIAFGCTGGKHRSITFAERAAEHYGQAGYNVRTVHRDKDKK